ncbi:RWD domain-containing protein 4 [Aplysia californica]|uniref:RWD domain-containing protein 4 n=1 Tax=Aplysia californica TaxID=6500 RepID=A0ABM0K9A1_APLCA|nr:RWD domain-containing protein 4 [Aplysia californica]
MSCEEMQKEELEVLESIYDGDEAYKQISDTVFQYKYGEDGSNKSFLVEVAWPSDYPEVLPEINLDVFYNKHVIPEVKEALKNGMTEQANDLLGMSMTFSLFEWVKDNLDDMLSIQPETPVAQPVVSAPSPEEPSDGGRKEVAKEKKEQLTKAQKRRIFDRFGANADKPRGWDWVDIIKHLAQTGGQKTVES